MKNLKDGHSEPAEESRWWDYVLYNEILHYIQDDGAGFAKPSKNF